VKSAGSGNYTAGGSPTTRTSQVICEVGFACIGGVKASCGVSDQFADEVGLAACKRASLCGVGMRINTPNTATSDTVCEDCAAGRYSIGGTADCTECESGKYITTTKAVGCILTTSCGAGKWIKTYGTPTSDVVCADCPAGKFSNGGTSHCVNCRGGSYSDESGASSCKTIPAGYKAIGQYRRGIIPCPAGTWSIGGGDECTDCERGKFSSSEGSFSCTDAKTCGAGERIVTPSNSTSDTVCQDCPQGTYSTGFKLLHWVACGGGNTWDCSEPDAPRDEEEAFPVRCCSDIAIDRWIRRPDRSRGDDELCSVWSEGGLSGGNFDCQTALSYQEAASFCAGVGGRLCTKDEVNDGCAQGTGCYDHEIGKSFDNLLIWTSTSIESYVGATSCPACLGAGEYSDTSKSASCKTAPAGHKPNDDRNGLEKCTPGTFSVGGSDTCESCGEDETSVEEGAAGCSNCATCTAGRYKIASCTSTTATQCGDCSAGQASMGGEATACTECNGPGQYSDEALSSACMTAPAGYKPKASRDGIEECPKNTFSIGASDNCTECADGGHSRPGSSACEKCTTGHYYDEDANICKLCASGTFTATGGVGLSACQKCPEGFYSSSPGAATCYACEAGKYANANLTECLLCPAGKISGVAQSSCVDCEVGKFSEDEGNSECLFCPSYQTSDKGSSSCRCKDSFVNTITVNSNEPCSCGPGLNLERGECVPCANGFFKSSTSLDACESCNKVALKGATGSNEPASSPLACTCGKGDFRSLEPPPFEGNATSFIGQCVECPEGTSCVEPGVTIEDLPLKRGFWRSTRNSSNVVKCYTNDACAQQQLQETANSRKKQTQCAMGHSGPLCDVCLPGYAKDVLGNCETCDGKKFHIPAQTWMFFSMLGIGIATVVYQSCLKKKKEFGRLAEFRKRAVTRGHQRGQSAASALVAAQNDRDNWLYRGRIKAKILISFFQILSSFEEIFVVHFPPIFEDFMRWISATLNLDAIQLLKADCVMDTNFYTKLMVQTLFPIILSVLIIVYYGISAFRHRADDAKRLKCKDFAYTSFITPHVPGLCFRF